MQALGSREHASISRDDCVAKFSVKRLVREEVGQCLAEPEDEQQGNPAWIHLLIFSKDSLEKEPELVATPCIVPTQIINLEAKHVALTHSYGSSDGLHLHEWSTARSFGCC